MSSALVYNWLWSIPVVTFGLGSWQLYRREWKLDLIAKHKEHIDKEASNVPLIYTDDMQFRRVKAHGTFLYDKEIKVGPRTRNDQEKSGGGVFTGPSQVGYYLFTPFLMKDRERPILVNRGWISKQNAHQVDQSNKDRDIEGVLRSGEPSNFFAIPNQPTKNQWFSINVEEMAKHANASPLLVELVAGWISSYLKL
jgi:surfeit locus 1 family protein